MENNNTILKKRICKHCNKPLKLIGVQRQNGNFNYSDFAARAFHKSCLKKVRTHSTVLKMIEQIESKIKKHNELVTEINDLEDNLFNQSEEINKIISHDD